MLLTMNEGHQKEKRGIESHETPGKRLMLRL